MYEPSLSPRPLSSGVNVDKNLFVHHKIGYILISTAYEIIFGDSISKIANAKRQKCWFRESLLLIITQSYLLFVSE